MGAVALERVKALTLGPRSKSRRHLYARRRITNAE